MDGYTVTQPLPSQTLQKPANHIESLIFEFMQNSFFKKIQRQSQTKVNCLSKTSEKKTMTKLH